MKGRSFQFLKQESNIQATSGEVQSVSCAKGEWQVQWSNVRSIMEEVGSIQRDVVSALYKRGLRPTRLLLTQCFGLIANSFI